MKSCICFPKLDGFTVLREKVMQLRWIGRDRPRFLSRFKNAFLYSRLLERCITRNLKYLLIPPGLNNQIFIYSNYQNISNIQVIIDTNSFVNSSIATGILKVDVSNHFPFFLVNNTHKGKLCFTQFSTRIQTQKLGYS